jgi:hypothetical protein
MRITKPTTNQTELVKIEPRTAEIKKQCHSQSGRSTAFRNGLTEFIVRGSLSNVPDQRPRASDAQHGTET